MILEVFNPFVKKDDIKPTARFKIVSDVFTKENKFNPDKKAYAFDLEINGQKKTANLNETSKKNIIAGYGNETTKWLGKYLTAECLPTLIAGERKDVIIYSPLQVDLSKLDFNSPSEVIDLPF